MGQMTQPTVIQHMFKKLLKTYFLTQHFPAVSF